MSQPITRVPLICGGGGFGAVGTHARVHDLSTVQAIVDTFAKAGHNGIDTAQMYGFGTSEEMLGQIDLKGARIDTKIYPVTPGDFEPRRLKELFQNSLDALRGNKIRVFYLHAPDRSVPLENTLQAVDDLYKEGKFEEFGLSNFNTWEVAEVVFICKANGYIMPTVYEGVYNCVDRTVEFELIPCLRRYGIRFAAYSPLAGGFLTGIHLDICPLKGIEPGSHFDPKLPFGRYLQKRYMPMVPHMKFLRVMAEKHNLTLNEIAVRWLQHHSILTPEDHGIIFGGSKVQHIEQTLKYSLDGPLPQEVLDVLEEMYTKVKGGLSHYCAITTECSLT